MQTREANLKLYRNGSVIAYVPPTGRKREAMIEMARKKRTYRKNRRVLTSAAVSLWEKKKKCLMFITYTFACDISETDANNIFSKHLNNLHENYGLGERLWVKEIQKKGRLHYHLLCDMRFVHPLILQLSFNKSVKNYNETFATSNNSVRYGKDVIIRDVRRLAKYVAKYCGKCHDVVFDKPAYAISNGISDISREITYDELEMIDKYFGGHKTYELSFALVIVIDGYLDCELYRKRLKRRIEEQSSMFTAPLAYVTM